MKIGECDYGAGHVLLAAQYSEENVNEAKQYCRFHGLTPADVAILKILYEGEEIIVVRVI